MSSDSFNVGVNMCASVRVKRENECHKVSRKPSVDLRLNFIMNKRRVAFSLRPNKKFIKWILLVFVKVQRNPLKHKEAVTALTKHIIMHLFFFFKGHRSQFRVTWCPIAAIKHNRRKSTFNCLTCYGVLLPWCRVFGLMPEIRSLARDIFILQNETHSRCWLRNLFVLL